MGMREYETIYILKADCPEEQQEKILVRVEKTIADFQGVMILKENWGKKKLSYDIARNSKGHYVFVNYMGGGSMVSEIERNLRLDDTVLRYMTVKVAEGLDPETRLAQARERRVEKPNEKALEALGLADDDSME